MPSDPTRPGGPRYSPVQRRLLTATAGLVVVALAAGAYVLTYPVLRELAETGRANHRWAPVYPVMVDALTAMTILALVIARNARWWTRLLRWALLLILVAGAAAAAVQHSVSGFGSLPHTPVRAGVAVAPHVMLVLAVWLWLTMIKQIRVARPASDAPEPVETQRGHVKVLPALELPASPAPAALEPAAAPDAEGDDARYAYEPEPGRPLDLFRPLDDSELDHGHAPDDEAEYEATRSWEPSREDHYRSEHEPPAGRDAEYDGASGFAAEHEHEEEREGEYEAAPESEDDDYEAEHGPLAAREHDAEDDHGYDDEYAEEYESEPSPPLDPLPEPRPAPALLPTDVELVRGRDAAGPEERAEERDRARTTRPDIAVPGADDAEEHDGPPADRAEDPDGGRDEDAPPVPRVPRPAPSPEDRKPGEGRIWDWNPPPSGNFRSGPTPPAE